MGNFDFWKIKDLIWTKSFFKCHFSSEWNNAENIFVSLHFVILFVIKNPLFIIEANRSFATL